MATCVSHSLINQNLYNDSLIRRGRASVGAPSSLMSKSSISRMRPGRSSVPAKYVPRTPSSSSGDSSDSKTDSSYGPKKKTSALSLFQPPASQPQRRSSFVDKILPQPKEPHLETMYGKCSTPLGSGTHASVMLCDSRARGRLYAIKRFRKQKPQESRREYNKRLFGEYCISSTMRHENIVETFDLIPDEENRLCLVMELCAGGDLFGYIKAVANRPPNYPEIYCYFKQLINGITYLHSMGVAHRDIKPENLLLSADGTVLKITDFGVAEVFKTVADRQAHKCVGLCGSEPYIAPEQFQDVKAEYDAAKVDIWSCGIVLYALLNGTMPWRRAARGDIDYERYLDNLKSVSRQSIGFHGAEHANNDVRDILYTLLQPDSHLRPSAKEIQQHKWVASIPACHTDDPSPHHTHYAMSHQSSSN